MAILKYFPSGYLGKPKWIVADVIEKLPKIESLAISKIIELDTDDWRNEDRTIETIDAEGS